MAPDHGLHTMAPEAPKAKTVVRVTIVAFHPACRDAKSRYGRKDRQYVRLWIETVCEQPFAPRMNM